MTDILNNFKKELNAALSGEGVLGGDAANVKRNFNLAEEDAEGQSKREKSIDYLKDGVTIKDILTLVRNKKLSNNKIKSEISKLLKDENELIDFLKSFKPKKEENKEATGTGAGSGSFETLFGGDMSEDDIKKTETKEATSSASSGQYSTPKAWAKSTSKKDWRGRAKTQIPGGKFVQVKKKCKRFPYCNQGDIKALNIFSEEILKKTIKNVSQKYGLSESEIEELILREINTNNK